MTIEYKTLETAETLVEWTSAQQGISWIAIDTEFMREKTYFPQVCLIQAATENGIVCIDPLAIEDLSSFGDLLLRDDVLKLLHAGRQDLEIFYQLFNKVPEPVYDTQIAASLLGMSEQIAYARLVQDLTGNEVDKSQTRTDWSRRPLSDAQLEYAASDVVHLHRIYQLQTEALEHRGQQHWLDDDFRALTDEGLYDGSSENLLKRVKGHRKLKGKGLLICKNLAEWREKLAREKDLPRKWILPDDQLLDISRIAPASSKDLSQIRGISSKTVKFHSDTILGIISAASSADRSEYPALKEAMILTEEQKATADLLMAVVRQLSSNACISAGYVASRADVDAMVYYRDSNKLMTGWRKHLVGDVLHSIIDGRKSVFIREGKLTVSD